MEQRNTIFVTGASGRQGGAVAASLLKNGYFVKLLTRNPSSPSIKALSHPNARVIQGDLDKPGNFADELKECIGVFCALTYRNGTVKETKQGIELADLAKQNGIRHFLYSSVIGADQHTRVPHWESKFKIENHIRQIGLPYTIIRPSSFFENFMIPAVKKRILRGHLPSPLNKNVVQQFISTRDIGEIAVTVFRHPEKYLQTSFAVASQQLDMVQVATLFSALTQKKVDYQKIPGFIVRLALGKNVYKMLRWVNSHDGRFVKDLDAFNREFPGLLDLEQWMKRYFIAAPEFTGSIANQKKP